MADLHETRPTDRWRTSRDYLPTTSARAVNGHPEPATTTRAEPVEKAKLGKVVAVYHYRDENGVELYSKIRYEPKTFRVRRPDGSWGIGDAPRVLYRLPEIRAAIAAGRPVLVVEGEKDADRAHAELGMAATCNYDGAAKADGRSKWRREYSENLRDARVLVIADHDEPGLAHARAVADDLAGIATQVGIFRAALDVPGADLSDHLDAGHDLAKLVAVPPSEPPTVAAAASQALPTLPETFWSARPAFTHIRAAAHAKGRCADLVLHATLARISGMVSHELRFDSGIGIGSLNYFAAAVGPSGIGKSTGADAAAELVHIPRHLHSGTDGTVRFRDGLPIGSGEGLAEAYMGTVARDIPGQFKRNGDPKTEKVRAQVRHNAFVYIDEGEALTRMSERSGATIGPTLRSAWNGQLLGQANAREESTRILPARSYSLGLLIGFQRRTCQPLLADVTAGTPQRFLWCSAVDASVPTDQPEHPGPLHVRLTDPLGEPLTGTIRFAEQIRAQLWRDNLDRVRGDTEGPELDSHAPLSRCKLAALFAVLDGRMHVSVADWDLSAVVWASSCAVRDALVAGGRRERAREQWIRDSRFIELKLRAAAEVGQVDAKLARIAELLGEYVGEDGAMTHGAARKRLPARDRGLYDAAVDHAVTSGRLRRVEGGICRPLEVVQP